MKLKENDTIYTLNKKINFLLRKDQENQYLYRDIVYIINSSDNTAKMGDTITFSNKTLINSNIVKRMFKEPWSFYSFIHTSKKIDSGNFFEKRETSFDNRLANTMCSIMFWDNQNIIESDYESGKYKKINNFLLPKEIDSFRIEIIDTYNEKESDGELIPDKIIKREFHIYDTDNVNIDILYEIEPDKINEETGERTYYQSPILIFDKGR